jgi:NTE family protein
LRTLTLCLLLFFTVILSAQEEDLKVGLVLSGGGARGYAHIGALQVLEEAGVRVDYIGGTSMGSIVGGLYAAGYSAHQLEEMLRSTNIMEELQDAVGRDNQKIYDKLYNDHYLFGLSMKDFSLQLPTALSDGQRIHDLFSHWTAHVGNINDFSKLPIPYLAVGTDIETGNAVVLEKGRLARAMRASAALPGIISPYEIDGIVMTDGGVSNNYPAEEIKAKGMDYIIGITVEQDPYLAEEINSLDKLLLQIAFFQATRRNVEQYATTDLDIKPDLGDYSQLSFEAIDALIAAGRQAAREQLSILRSVAERQQGPRPQPDTSAVQLPEYLNAISVKIEGNQELSRRQVLAFFRGKLPGRISWADFREDLVALYATGRYSNIDYAWEPLPGTTDGEVALTLKLSPRPEFGQRLRIGLHYDQEYRANLLVGLRLNDLIVDNTITTLDLIGGDRFRYRAEFRVDRVNGSAFGLRSRLHYADVGFDIPETMGGQAGITIDQLDFRFSDLSGELYWDFRQTENSFTGIAAELKYYQTLSDQVSGVDSSSLFSLTNDLYFAPKVYFLYDKLNDKNLPMRGFSLNAQARAIRRLETDAKWAYNGDLEALFLFPTGRSMSWGLELAAGGFLEESALPFRYYLGSNNRNLMNNFRAFPSLELGEASGNFLLLGELFTRFHAGGGHYFTLGGRGARLVSDEDLPSSLTRTWIAAGRLTYSFDSPLGPVELTYAHGNVGGNLYFNLGYWF